MIELISMFYRLPLVSPPDKYQKLDSLFELQTKARSQEIKIEDVTDDVMEDIMEDVMEDA